MRCTTLSEVYHSPLLFRGARCHGRAKFSNRGAGNVQRTDERHWAGALAPQLMPTPSEFKLPVVPDVVHSIMRSHCVSERRTNYLTLRQIRLQFFNSWCAIKRERERDSIEYCGQHRVLETAIS
eukprot:2660549-Amphidinium_carterae.1